jgi:hypothetical protein
LFSPAFSGAQLISNFVQVELGKCPHQGEPAYRHHHRSATALQKATRDEHVDVARYSAQTRNTLLFRCGRHHVTHQVGNFFWFAIANDGAHAGI